MTTVNVSYVITNTIPFTTVISNVCPSIILLFIQILCFDLTNRKYGIASKKGTKGLPNALFATCRDQAKKSLILGGYSQK